MGRVAFVTGGTRGIGRAIVERLKNDGFEVAAGYSGNEAAAQACASELGVMVVKGNVGQFEDCGRAVEAVTAELGPIEVLVNNAGITRDGVFHKMTAEQWSEVIRVNMDSVFNMTRHVIEGMRDRGWGRVINISSINGQKGQMGQTNYSAAKAGVIGFTKSLALEVGRDNVLVNAIAPGPIETPLVDGISADWESAKARELPLGRFGPAEEVAPVALLLASDPGGNLFVGQTLGPNSGDVMP